ncbi:MAG: hypothetical protein ACR2FK_04940 [Sphingomicrobium sp.]
MSGQFSLPDYRAMIEAGRESGYRYLTFAEVADGAADEGRQCLLRHDVDASIAFALDMAHAEAAAGVRSTYFLMPRSPAYNLLGRHASLAVREMVGLGHDVGLHFDAAHPLVSAATLDRLIAAEAALVGELSGNPVRAFSFHQPSAEIIAKRVAIPGLINTYNPDQLEGWHYVSDSNRLWKAETGLELLREATHPKLQLLVHPMWWVSDAATTEQVWDEAIGSNFEIMQQQFLDTERAYGGRRAMELKRNA